MEQLDIFGYYRFCWVQYYYHKCYGMDFMDDVYAKL